MSTAPIQVSPGRGRLRFAAEGILPFAAAGIMFGILYNTLFYPRTLVEYLEAGTIGLLLGTAIGLAEHQTSLRRWFQRHSFARAILIRTLAYSFGVALTLSLVLSVEPATLGECEYAACVAAYLGSPPFARDLVFSTAFAFSASFLAQLVLLVGPRNVARLLTGRYHRPQTVYAEFMFVDLRGSTTAAEVLGDERFSALLRDFFVDISAPIHESRGEVCQYIGDAALIVWQGRRAAGRWLDCFDRMRAVVIAGNRRYVELYGLAPGFKAGVHAGRVVITEVGTLQRAHVYHGDVLNTAARIQSRCNELGFALLASNQAVASLDPAQRARFQAVSPVSLRGKSEAVALLGLVPERGDAIEGAAASHVNA
ncbi:MAG TPA: adenylate/guanylate cyclase domain-containing protein [Longimicrobiales bacterium]|nr:adenylate/guanylate cyclase domain-containing protein [Longimicrobiales bacterium]